MPPADNRHAGEGTPRSKYSVRRRALLGTIGTAGTAFIAGCGGGGDGGGGDGGDGGGDGGGGDGGDGGGDGGGGDGGGAPSQYFITDVPGNPPSLDPHALEPTDNNSDMAWPLNAYETLVFYEEGGPDLIPVLATEVPTVDNGLITNGNRTYEFPLKEGVQFHTGGEMTSEDVRYSIERVTSMGLAPNVGTVEAIESIETPDDYTIILTTDQVRPGFLNGAVPSKNMVVMSKEAIEANGGVQDGQRNEYVAQNTVGTGPYMLGDWQRGSSMRWDYFEDYHAPATVGPGGVFQRILPDVASSVAHMTEGTAHHTNAEAGDFEAMESAGVTISELASLEQLFLFFNYEIPYDRDDMPDDDTVPSSFLQDKDVRRAFGFAIDYDEYYDQVWSGFGTRAKQPCHLPGMPFFDEDAPNFNYDADMAEELLRSAGYWEEGFTFTIMSENFSEAEATILYLKDSFESLNDRITINTLTMPEAQYIERRNKDPWSFTVDAGGFPSFGPDPAPYYNNLLEGPAAEGGRHREYIDDRFYDLAEQAATTLELETREQLYSELQALGFEDPPALSLLAEGIPFFHLPCVEPEINSALSQNSYKRFDISACEPINF